MAIPEPGTPSIAGVRSGLERIVPSGAGGKTRAHTWSGSGAAPHGLSGRRSASGRTTRPMQRRAVAAPSQRSNSTSDVTSCTGRVSGCEDGREEVSADAPETMHTQVGSAVGRPVAVTTVTVTDAAGGSFPYSTAWWLLHTESWSDTSFGLDCGLGGCGDERVGGSSEGAEA